MNLAEAFKTHYKAQQKARLQNRRAFLYMLRSPSGKHAMV